MQPTVRHYSLQFVCNQVGFKITGAVYFSCINDYKFAPNCHDLPQSSTFSSTHVTGLNKFHSGIKYTEKDCVWLKVRHYPLHAPFSRVELSDVSYKLHAGHLECAEEVQVVVCELCGCRWSRPRDRDGHTFPSCAQASHTAVLVKGAGAWVLYTRFVAALAPTHFFWNG